MDEIEFGVLQACQEYVKRQLEMLPALAAAIGVAETDVFYTKMRRPIAQRGTLPGGDWAYFFHGYECDLRNLNDGRFLRVDFGPEGRVGILNSYGVLRLIMTSVLPWREFPKLRSYFAKDGPPYHENSGDWQKMSELWDRLDSQGFFEQTAPSLVALQAKHTKRGVDGLNHIDYSSEIADETRFDCAVAHRQQLSPKAIAILKGHVLGETSRVESSDNAKSSAVTA